MSFSFDVEQANIVAYLTTADRTPPRVSYEELRSFLGILSGVEPGPEGVLSEALISNSPDWVAAVKQTAALAWNDLANHPGWSEQVPEREMTARLAAIRSLLSNYHLFGLAVGSWQDDQQLRAFINYAAVDSGHNAMILIPTGWNGDRGIRLLDPFPAVALAAERSQDWPGVVFWSRNGIAAFSPLQQAKDLYHELRAALSSPRHLDRILEEWRRRSEKANILQLSDLHFGNEWAQEKEPYLSTHLHSISQSVARVVITGDLFNEPRPEEARAFQSFRTALERERGQEAIVIPGNHDQKWRGNLRQDLKQIDKVEWSNVVVDDSTRCVFLCFDSSRDANLARGKVTTEQRIQVATQLDQLMLRRPEIKDYLLVALIHHHPFSFESPKETLVSRLLENVGITDEYFLRMEDADSFLAWCGSRGVGLILHGHKHLPRYREELVTRADGSSHMMTTVGCGTSLGAEVKPLSYNKVSWNSQARRWVVSFFMDPGDGSGFRLECLSQRGLD
jgi:UDP-2,3-diacylglucosamine pyrophosphatase LpxH